MSKQYKFLLTVTIIVLGTIWFLSVKKEDFREEEVVLLHQKFIEAKVSECLGNNGFIAEAKRDTTAEIRKKCLKKAEAAWKEELILNTGN